MIVCRCGHVPEDHAELGPCSMCPCDEGAADIRAKAENESDPGSEVAGPGDLASEPTEVFR